MKMFKFWGFQRKIKIYADENFSNGSNCLNNFMTFFIVGKCAVKLGFDSTDDEFYDVLFYAHDDCC